MKPQNNGNQPSEETKKKMVEFFYEHTAPILLALEKSNQQKVS